MAVGGKTKFKTLKNELMKWNYKIYFGICVVCMIVFVIFSKYNSGLQYTFLGLTIGALLRGVYEMYKANKVEKTNTKE
jgi:hypothetical protein